MLSEISQTEKGEYIMISLILESKNVELIETVSRLVVTRGGGGGREGGGEMGQIGQRIQTLNLLIEVKFAAR